MEEKDDTLENRLNKIQKQWDEIEILLGKQAIKCLKQMENERKVNYDYSDFNKPKDEDEKKFFEIFEKAVDNKEVKMGGMEDLKNVTEHYYSGDLLIFVDGKFIPLVKEKYTIKKKKWFQFWKK